MSTENKNETGVETEETVEMTGTENNTEITMTQADFDKKIQSAEDKLRTQYSKQIKELEQKVKELTPVQKTEAELDYEKRLSALEAREKAMNMQDALKAKGIASEFGTYLRDDIDMEAFSTLIDNMVQSRVDERVKSAYKPEKHKTGEGMTKEDFRKLPYAEREKIFNENPELFKALTSR